jgi:hypothetical protein
MTGERWKLDCACGRNGLEIDVNAPPTCPCGRTLTIEWEAGCAEIERELRSQQEAMPHAVV